MPQASILPRRGCCDASRAPEEACPFAVAGPILRTARSGAANIRRRADGQRDRANGGETTPLAGSWPGPGLVVGGLGALHEEPREVAALRCHLPAGLLRARPDPGAGRAGAGPAVAGRAG